MADEADLASAREEEMRQQALAKHQGFALAQGVQGECDLCGEWSGRLVGAVCAPCRDKYRLG